jgi:hypothetical protein
MGELILLLDLIAALAVSAIAYILYKKFVAPSPQKNRLADIAYEQGFSDAVRYFGLRKLYEDDPFLKERMNQVFNEAGTPHKFLDVFETKDRRNDSDRPQKAKT